MLGVAAVVLALDQAAKLAVRASLEPGERHELMLGFDLTRVTNDGIAFGLLGDGGALVVAVTAVALLAVLAWFALAPERGVLWLGVGLLLGGALGNLVDRIGDGAVTDFVDPPAWPAFNLADVAITAGVVALVLAALAAPEEEPAGP
jgi:signal peptidase II